MKMYDTGKVLIGLLVFAGFMLSPFVYNTTLGQGAKLPELSKPAGEHCIKDVEDMRANHMDLLNTWRNEVVRFADRTPVKGMDGKLHEKSLTRTCLGCHGSKVEFCDKCHAYASVSPTCWNCHVDGGGK